MFDLFAFREFREGLAMMRDGDPEKAMGFAAPDSPSATLKIPTTFPITV